MFAERLACGLTTRPYAPDAAPVFDSPLRALIGDRPNLAAYLARIDARYFADRTWPSM